MTPTHLLVIDRVAKSHGRTPALRDVSFQVQAGELFGLLGPNGAGKSTLLSLLAGLSSPTSGELVLNGERFDPARRDLRPLIGIAPQDLAVYPELTARENLHFFGSLYGLRGAALTSRVAEVLEGIALTDRSDQRVKAMSGGMKRRLNLGAAIVHRPTLLLLDEPTTGVDPQSRNHIFETVRRLNRDGLTVVYTSHYMEEVQALCTRLAILDAGVIVACDTLDHLLGRRAGEVRFRFHGDLPAGLDALPGVQSVEASNGRVVLKVDDTGRSVAALVGLFDGVIEGLEARPPDLESVFLQLTGHGLRD